MPRNPHYRNRIEIGYESGAYPMLSHSAFAQSSLGGSQNEKECERCEQR